MNMTYEQAKDLHVRAITVYGKTADKKLYWDKAGANYTNQVKQVELEDLFIKGILVIDNGTDKLIPVGIKANKVYTLTVTAGDSSNTVAGFVWEAEATA